VVGPHLVVAEGHHQQHGQAGDAPAELGQPVQGGFVGPVHVLDDHEHGPWPRNLVEERGEDLLARRACEQTRREWPADRAGDVVQRA
jgi:hypothetical protein